MTVYGRGPVRFWMKARKLYCGVWCALW